MEPRERLESLTLRKFIFLCISLLILTFFLLPRKIGNKIIRRVVFNGRKVIKAQWEGHWAWFRNVGLLLSLSCLTPQGRLLKL